MRPPFFHLRLILGAALLSGLAGCATLQQIAALRDVSFTLDRISDLRMAGVDLGDIQSFDDLSIANAGRIVLAVTRNELPVDFRLHLQAENPAENAVEARLVEMDWTLFLEDRETLSGVLDREILLPPGQPTDIPLTIRLDLLEFFEGNARDLVALALSLAGQGGAPKELALRATPTIQTPLGPMRYPGSITILAGSTPGGGPPCKPEVERSST